MFIDLSVPVSASMREQTLAREPLAAFGHLGTHFDVMNKPFPLSFLERPGIAFDVSGAGGRDIAPADLDLSLVQPGMFIALHTGFSETAEYGSPPYFTSHPQLSPRLIDDLVARQISILGIDCAGVRRGPEHTPTDQYCADHGVFIVENLCHLRNLLDGHRHRLFTAHTYPVHFLDMTGLPCRVAAEI